MARILKKFYFIVGIFDDIYGIEEITVDMRELKDYIDYLRNWTSKPVAIYNKEGYDQFSAERTGLLPEMIRDYDPHTIIALDIFSDYEWAKEHFDLR